VQPTVGEVILPADDVRDAEVGVVHDAGEVVGGAAVGADERDPPEADGALAVLFPDRDRGLAMALGPFALPDGAFLEADPEPLEVGEDPLFRARHAPRCVRVVDAQDQHPAVLVREAPVGHGGERAAEVERAGRAGRETDANHLL
jgi:hypothetical protein